MPASVHIAVDLGAESGRVIAGYLERGRIRTNVVHRFENVPILLADHLYWDLPLIWREVLKGLRLVPPEATSVGVDGWGVDFALLGHDGMILGLPRHYRDTANQVTYHGELPRLDRSRIFSATGIQSMPINTLFQLLSLRASNPLLLDASAALVMMPDVIHYLLTGRVQAEWTNVSTSQLADPRTQNWSWNLIDHLRLPRSIFPAVVPPGTVMGGFRDSVKRAVGRDMVVVSPATHDTASAIAAIPAVGDDNWAYISSGTWSLVGFELPKPVITPAALEANVTNEAGIDGTTRFLKNVMGLWILQECRRTWGDTYTYESLTDMAREATPYRSLINPDSPVFLEPNSLSRPMPERICEYCRRTEQPVPDTPGEIVRSVFDSLSLKYRQVIEDLAGISKRRVSRVHVVGGGAKNSLLCQLTADATGLKVLAGPDEATALGNLLVSARAVGTLVESGAGIRDIIRRSFSINEYFPNPPHTMDQVFRQFSSLP